MVVVMAMLVALALRSILAQEAREMTRAGPIMMLPKPRRNMKSLN